MDKIAGMIGEKMGDMVEDAVKSALGCKDKDKDDEKKGGFMSFFGGDKDKEDEKDKGGLFSFGDEKKKEEEKGGFFSKILNRDDDDDGKEKSKGFAGLFNELEGAAGGPGGQIPGGNYGEGSGGMKGQTVGVNDGDLLSDLMDVAEETSQGK